MKKNFHIYPIFLPFAGCPQICMYCDQASQTGNKENLIQENMPKVLDILAKTEGLLLAAPEKNKEIAFYGGTFTAMDENLLSLCLNFIRKHKALGNVQQARCSTRPDSLSTVKLSLLKEFGMDTIELGIQSFHTKALTATLRGYTGEEAIKACKAVKKAGFRLGIQLLPNLPGQKPEEFIKDVETALALQPDFLRFYPCLVVENTGLAQLWKEGKHKVWAYEETLEVLAKGLHMAWQADVPVIRIGVAPEQDFYNKILAGIQHPNLGQQVQAKALTYSVEAAFKAHEKNCPSPCVSKELYLPLHTKGYYMPAQNKEFWEKLNCKVTFISCEKGFIKTSNDSKM